MRKYWQLLFGIVLITASIIFYLIHYMLFHDSHHIFLYLFGDIAFVPIEVLLVTLIIHKLLEVKKKKAILEKLNMLVGVFFSEVGKELINYLSKFDRESENIEKKLRVEKDWCEKDFSNVIDRVKSYKCNIEIDKMDLKYLERRLKAKRGFIVTMLQNPVLLEHETFTDLVRNLFHLDEEFSTRLNVSKLSEIDKIHIKSDIENSYNDLIVEWIYYMRYLKNNFPNLFMFSIATNPFTNNDSNRESSQS